MRRAHPSRRAASGFALALLLLAGCASAPAPSPRAASGGGAIASEKPTPAVARPGGYYQDDGPGDNPPADLERIPDAEPKAEPLHRFANNPYIVFGRTYVPDVSGRPYVAEGIASWYGRKFHGARTSSGEPYDMYAMTAAHPTLPIPSYARVTNLANGKSVIVRINDRGPFHSDRLIDLSYTAAYKLGLVRTGSGRVRVESIDPANWNNNAIATAAETDDAAWWVQLGAFSLASNAEQMLSRVKVQVAALADRLRLVEGEGVVRLRAGPFASRSEADEAAALVRRLTELAPLVIR
ncbi:septal ring lytic transglycosylase RlpA family protein [Thiobacter aerophilum]|uniref:Endolytic peptidoglycan transglycosylase RlpA n=1 Tax=Thiobacter aerophilum TaxID=3121275 RepID=A0ABV0EDK4_9BURK